MDPEEQKEKKVTRSYEIEESPPKKINWRKIGWGLLFALATGVFFTAGYLAVMVWQRYAPGSFLIGPNLYEDWQVYRNESYLLGVRYPDTWEVVEINPNFTVFRPKVQTEGEVLPKDYIHLTVAATSSRVPTACEQERSACSFFANNIYGERILTPESETILFTKDGNDFSLTWSKFGEADLATIFDEMGKSLRFVTGDQETKEIPLNTF